MSNVYETPAIIELGDFRQETGEFIGPYTEYILPFDDHSYEG